MTFETRQYQVEDIEYGINHGPEITPIHCIATGGGKTYCQAMIAKHEFDAGNAVGIVTPREEIFDQTHNVAAEIIGAKNLTKLMAGHHWRPYQPVHIISWDTLTARVKRSENWFPSIRRLIVDEAHLSLSPLKMKVLEYYRDKGVIIDGYTATPARKTGRGLGSFYTNIKNVISVRQLIEQGYLAPCEYWGAKLIDTSGVRKNAGDYNTTELAKRTKLRHGDMVDAWGELASDRHTIVFAVNVADCEALTDRYRQAGVRAVALHSSMSKERRRQNDKAFREGKAQVLVNVGIASYGYDSPKVDCIQLGRPTKSLVLWLQMIGRGMRPAAGKDHCMVIDHTGGLRDPELGYADELRRWHLDERKKGTTNWSRDGRNERKEKDEPKRHECSNCQHHFSGQLICPHCGTEVPLPKKEVEYTDCEFVRYSRQREDKQRQGIPDDLTFFLMLRHFAHSRGMRLAWAAYRFKEARGFMPPRAWNSQGMIPPTVRVSNWAHSQVIAFSRRRKSERAAR